MVRHQAGRLLDRAKAVLVDGVFVVLVELEQAPGVSQCRNEPFEQLDLVESAKQLRQPRR